MIVLVVKVIKNGKYKKMKGVFLQLYNWFKRPFEKEYEFFLLLFFVFGLINSFGYILFSSVEKTLGILCHHFLLTYVLAMVLSYLCGKVKVVYKTVIITLMVLAVLIDLICVNAFHYTYTRDTIALIMGTNTSEFKEMWETYFSFSVFFQTILIVAATVLIYRLLLLLLKYKREAMLKAAMFFLWLNVAGFLYVSHTWSAWQYISITRFFLVPKVASSPDLHQYLQHPKFKSVTSRTYPNMVWIIGESFTKFHSSLYGYEKETNPLLVSLQKDSLLYVFSDVTSSACHTIEAFQSIMSTYRPEYGDRVKWYECLTVPEMMHTLGYYSFWISNQNRYGVHDNVVTKYAELCDTTFFLHENLGENEILLYDDQLLPKIDEALSVAQKKNKNFYVVHLLGSHPKFKKRYPESFNHFLPEEYSSGGDSEKRQLSQYDNSVLFNDRVVYDMIRRFDNDETMIFYFPDHGLDIYQTRSDYAGHAIRGNAKSMEVSKQIPFMVYMNENFQRQNPDIVKKIKEKQDAAFETQDMIYFLMDILGVELLH